jgi:hypothetical protein
VWQTGRRHFGVNDRLRCPSCGGVAYLSRRTPHPELGRGYEQQTFTCKTCGHEQIRDADKDGEVRPDGKSRA